MSQYSILTLYTNACLVQVAPGLSFLCLSSDESKIVAFAHCTEAAQEKGLRANAWVAEVLGSVGGKGGGKPGSAQGSVQVSGDNSMDQLITTMTKVAENKL